jgi:dimeric dUTPase (all-alpha-NTP-PPase superfamily)
VKDYVLHLFSESNSLLDCINWKVGLNDEIKLNREKILEEWIDVFKFFLSIGHLFGFEVRDLVDMYWKKSAKVVEKYKAKEQ